MKKYSFCIDQEYADYEIHGMFEKIGKIVCCAGDKFERIYHIKGSTVFVKTYAVGGGYFGSDTGVDIKICGKLSSQLEKIIKKLMEKCQKK
jgi:hypothetical protein